MTILVTADGAGALNLETSIVIHVFPDETPEGKAGLSVVGNGYEPAMLISIGVGGARTMIARGHRPKMDTLFALILEQWDRARLIDVRELMDSDRFRKADGARTLHLPPSEKG